MRYLITGRLLSIGTFLLYFDIFNLNYLTTLENVFGWFLIEHVFEEYSMNAGKLFIVYEDFRTLIINILLIIRNLFFIAQFFTPFEFLLINCFLITLIIICNNNVKFKKFKFLLSFVYLSILNSFIFVDTIFILNVFVLISVLHFLTKCVITYISLIYFTVFTKLSNLNKYNFYIKLNFIKISLIIILVCKCFFAYLIYLDMYSKFDNNFIQEFVLKLLTLYLYFIY